MAACQAIEERRELIRKLQLVAGNGSTKSFDGTDAAWENGTEKALAVTWSVLHGIVNEYFDGGDQMVENCSCGEHTGSWNTNGTRSEW
jgi:hypothetical protein